MYKKASLVIVGITLFILCFFAINQLLLKSPKIVVVDSKIIFENFNLTKDLKKEGEKEVLKLNRKIDSLQLILNNLNSAPNQHLSNIIIEEKIKLQNYSEKFTADNTVKIWDRINLYIKEYGEKNEVDIIIPYSGQMNVRYYQKNIDATEDILIFINTKYEGK